MSQQIIDIGTTPNDGTGDPLRTSQIKVNENFSELYSTILLEDDLLIARSNAVDQCPGATDVSLQIEFGPALASPNNEVSLASDGTLTINESGSYFLSVYMNTGRTGGGGVAHLYGRALVDGVQISASIMSMIDDADVNIPLQFQFFAELEVGMVVTFEIYRDSAGNNSGCLLKYDPSLVGWIVSPTASLTVRKAKPSTDVIPPQRNNLHLIQDPSELPDPVAGVHILEENHDYEINGIIDITPNRIQRSGKNTIYGLNAQADLIKSDSAFPMIFGDGTGQVSKDISFINTSGPLFDFIDTAGNESINVAYFDTCFFINSPSIGNFENLRINQTVNCLLIDMVDGMSVSGVDNQILKVSGNLADEGTTGMVVDLGTSVSEVISINDNAMDAGVGAVFLSGLTDSQNVSTTGLGSVTNNITYGGNAANIVGITPFDDRWLFNGNNTVLDTPFSGAIYIENNLTATVISAASPVKVAGVTVATIESRFTMTDDNQITYDDAKGIVVEISVSLSAKKTGGGGEQDYIFMIYVGGVPLDGASSSVQVKDKTNSISVLGVALMSKGQTAELWVKSVSTGDDITVESMQMVVKKI